LEVTEAKALQIAYIMNISVLFIIVFRSGSSKVLLMTGHHKFLSKVAMIESFFNVVFSIIFIKLVGIIGVALGTLLPNVVISIFFIFPAACRFSKVKPTYYFYKIYLPVLLNTIIPAAILLIFRNYLVSGNWNLWKLAYSAAPAAIIYFFTGYLFILTKADKQELKDTIQPVFQKFKTAIFRKNLTEQ